MIDMTQNTDAPRPKVGQNLSVFYHSLRLHMRRYALVILTSAILFFGSIIASVILGKRVGLSAWPYIEMVFGLMLPIMVLASMVVLLLYFMLIKRPASPLKAMWAIYRPLLCEPQRYAKAVPSIIILVFGFIGFTDFKGLLPDMQPFAWDERFMVWDRILHFGRDPWLWLDPVLGGTVPTLIINFFYNIWFFIMFGFWLIAGWSRDDRLWQRQFLLSFVLCWGFGGVVVATLFSSMGPAFYDLINPVDNPYAAQMAGLYAIHETHTVMALGVQETLRDGYLNPAIGKLNGISAMPSLHNATSTLFMLVGYRIHKYLGHVMLAFLAMIMIGSVHLAWHYAVDAYVGVALALAIWWMSGRLLRWQDRVLNVPSTR